jgi:hypothetical protein
MPINFAILREDRDFRCRADDAEPFYVGRRVSFHGRIGLKNDHDAIIKTCVYDPAAYRERFGFWADFVAPTAQVESQSSFIALNTYDRAAFTFGFPQFAAHVPGGDFVQYFRSLLERAEAHDYFPNLILKGGHIQQVELNGEVPLETDASTEPLQKYLNPSAGAVDDEEVIAAAKLIHWTRSRVEAQALQVQRVAAMAKAVVQRVDRRINVDGRNAAICLLCFDILHQGRGGHDTFPRLEQALRTSDPVATLLTIGADEFPERIRGLKAALQANPAFAARRWSRAAADFVN